jgi:hypothetical protein
VTEIDSELSILLTAVVNERRSQNLPLEEYHQEIKRLLDAGATASQLDPNELKLGANLGDIVDSYLELIFKGRAEYETTRMFDTLMELVCSPCSSWREHKRYAGNGGLPLPWFMSNFLFQGDPWGYQITPF